MKVLRSIMEHELFPEKEKKIITNYTIRPTVKIIIKNEKGEIALIGNKMNPILQLPGGGVESGETLLQCARRESIEETGCKIKNAFLFATQVDFRDRDKRETHNYCFRSDVKKNLGRLRLTPKEQKQGIFLAWFSPEDVLQTFRSQRLIVVDEGIPFYHTSFNVLRDLLFFEEYMTHYN